MTVSDTHLKISPRTKLTSKLLKNCRRLFAQKRQNSPVRPTRVYDASCHSGTDVVRQPCRVEIGNEIKRTGKKCFSADQIASCNTLGESPETLFMVCHSWRTCRSFVFVFRFSGFERCEMFRRRIKKLFRIEEEEDVKAKNEKRFSCPFLDSYKCPLLDPCDDFGAKTNNQLRRLSTI